MDKPPPPKGAVVGSTPPGSTNPAPLLMQGRGLGIKKDNHSLSEWKKSL